MYLVRQMNVDVYWYAVLADKKDTSDALIPQRGKGRDLIQSYAIQVEVSFILWQKYIYHQKMKVERQHKAANKNLRFYTDCGLT